MTDSSHRPRDILLGSEPISLTGRGCRVLLLDSGIEPALDMGGRHQRVDALDDVDGEDRGDAHGYRGASICGGGADSSDSGEPLGIAPEVELLSARYQRLMPDGYESLIRSVTQSHGRVDVIGHAYSFPDTHDLAHEGRAMFALVSDADASIAATHIAAAGHDGEKGVRFPASCESVLAVGTCREDGSVAHYCSIDSARRKPELLVPDLTYATRLEDESAATMRGTSAASNLVAGLAALWCERLRAEGLDPVPALVRAALLASSLPGKHPAHRLATADAALRGKGMLFAWYADADRDRQWRLRLRVAAGQEWRLCAVARRGRRSSLWEPPLLPVSLRVSSKEAVVEASEDGWVLVAGRQTTDDILDVEVKVQGPTEGIALVAVGAQVDAAPSVVRSPRAPRPSRVIVGISCSHDESACVIRDGKLEKAIQLERISRKKHDGRGFLQSRDTVDYCLHALGLTERDVDLFAYNLQPIVPGYVGLNTPTADADFDLFDPFGDRAVYVSHHLAHAFSAFFASPFENAAVFVADGTGGSTMGADDLILRGPEYERYLAQRPCERPRLHVQSTYIFGPESFRLVDRETAWSFNPRCGSTSLGEVYAAVSEYVFGDWQEGSGKLMGLAPYGDPDACGPSFLFRDDNGRLQFRADWKNRFRQAIRRQAPHEYRDLAARVQRDLETALLDRIRHLVATTGMRKVAYAGGIALNSVANDRMLNETDVEELFVIPASHDAGVCVGAAAAAEFLLTSNTKGAPVPHDFHGYAYREIDVARALAAYEGVLSWQSADLDDVVARLDAGQIIGLFDGGAELGPRALGHRSILADPRRRETWQYLNRNIKFREDFRPFAPAVVEERMSEFFEMSQPSPFMLRVVPVRPEYREKLGAITHVNGSARVQTVNREHVPLFHELLTRFGARTGIPILVNTSLNVRGEAIVETPRQAIELLLATHLDGLLLGPYFVTLQAASKSSLDIQQPIALAPKCEVVCTSRAGEPRARLRADARGRREYDLDDWAFQVLSHADGKTPLQELLHRFLPSTVSMADAHVVLNALYTLRLILSVRSVSTNAKETVTQDPKDSGEVAGHWKGLEALLEARDRAPLDPGTLRSTAATDTHARVMALRARLCVTRVASVTGYDLLGIPVATALRPITSTAQITATQGKGLCELDARVSALMESVERYSASTFAPQRRGSCSELQQAGLTVLTPEDLGAPPVGDAVLEWVCGTSLRTGQAVWVPAADVIFPYFAPPGVTRPMRPCTTGIASGNTLCEAVIQALCEVAERDACSQHEEGAGAPLLDLEAVDDEVARILIDRFAGAGVRLFVADLNHLTGVPVYVASTWSGDGETPPAMFCGQGAHLLPQIALRRALLEAAQSRVVGIQGSREDLIRHATTIQVTNDEARELWEKRHAAAQACGRTFLVPRNAPRSVAEMAETLLEILLHAGYDNAVYTNLTHPDVAMPVAHVVIPGMVDSFVDPARRRRLVR